jgi:hypothetical protein
VAAVHEAFRACCGEFARGAGAWHERDGASARAGLAAVRERANRNAAATLRAARIPEGPTLARLVRIIVASAG